MKKTEWTRRLFCEGTHPTLEAVLARREARVLQYRAMLQEGADCVLCFKLNIPGPIKHNAALQALFSVGVRAIRQAISGQCLQAEKEEALPTGCEYFASLKEDPPIVKRKMVEIEEKHPLGRLFDIDVETAQGAVSRETIGVAERRCFLCENSARACARSRRHSVEEMQRWISDLVENARVSDELEGERSLYELNCDQ